MFIFFELLRGLLPTGLTVLTNYVEKKLLDPASYYRDSCIALLQEVRALYISAMQLPSIRMVEEKDLPMIFKFNHEVRTVDEDKKNGPPINLKERYSTDDYTLGRNILRDICQVGIAKIVEFIYELNQQSEGVLGRVIDGLGNRNDSVRMILNFEIDLFVILSKIDIASTVDKSDPILAINFLERL